MVGVGGRSRGCKTCRQARVKCDESRPVCNRCVRLGLSCEGYPAHQTFIDGLSLVEIRTEGEPSTTSDRQGRDMTSRIVIPETPPIDEDYIFKMHLMSSLLVESQRRNTPGSTAPWLAAIIQPNAQNQTSQLALKSLAATYYGKLHYNQQAILKGSTLYTQVLSQIQKDLRDAQLVLDETTLGNVLFLAVYELVTFKNTTGWLTHCLGIGQLIKFRGPHRHQSGIGKDLFMMTRNTIVLAHLIEKKRCFLEEPAWKYVPWAENPASKDFTHYLLDLFCDLPGIIEDFLLLLETPTSSESFPTMWTSLGGRMKSCLESLYRWRQKREDSFANSYYPVGFDDLKRMKAVHLDVYPLGTAIFFENVDHAAELCLYNSMLVLLHRAWQKLPSSMMDTSMPIYIPLVNPRPHPSILLNPGEGVIKDYVTEICMLVYQQLLNYPGTSGALRLMFPLQIVYRNIDLDSNLAKWLFEIISNIANVYGFEAVNYASRFTDATIII